LNKNIEPLHTLYFGSLVAVFIMNAVDMEWKTRDCICSWYAAWAWRARGYPKCTI